MYFAGKRRRQTKDFPGSEIILQQIKEKPSTKRVGLVSTGPPARGGTLVLHDDQKIGYVTSGCPSPSLGVNVAMAYVDASKAKIGTKVQLEIRKKLVEATVTKMPFMKSNYVL